MAVWTSYLALLSSSTFIASPREKLVQWLGDYSWTFSIWNGFGSLDSCYLSILFFSLIGIACFNFWRWSIMTSHEINFSLLLSLSPFPLCLYQYVVYAYWIDSYLIYTWIILFRWMIHTFRIYDRNCFQYLRLNIP